MTTEYYNKAVGTLIERAEEQMRQYVTVVFEPEEFQAILTELNSAIYTIDGLKSVIGTLALKN